MSPTDIAALTTAIAGLLAALAQWGWLAGPRRNGHLARLPYIEARLTLAERALARCRENLRRERRRRRALRRHPRDPVLGPATGPPPPTQGLS